MKKVVSILLLLALLIFIALSCFYIVRTDQYAIITEFARVKQPIIKEAGLYLKLPYPVSSVFYLDKKSKIFTPKPLEVFLPDEQNILKNIIISYYIVWSIEDPLKFYEVLKETTSAEIRLRDNTRSYVYNTLSEYPFKSLVSTNEKDIKIDIISEEITESSQKDFLRDYGIKIELINIKRILLPEQNKGKVFERMVAERDRISNKYRAEGEEQAKIIISETDKNKNILISQAKLEAEKIIAKATAQASEIYAEAFEKDKEFYKFWRLLQSYKKIFNDNTTFILSTKNKLFDLLDMGSDILNE